MTLIGVLSDSHGHADTTARAIRVLRDAGAERFLHLGDIETEQVLDELIGLDARIVLGNCDIDERGLSSYAEHMGIAVDHPVGEITVDDRRIAFTHGHLKRATAAALDRRPDYLLHGHTHEVRDERIDGVRIVNPGALFRAARYTVAVLDPSRDDVRFLEVAREDHARGVDRVGA